MRREAGIFVVGVIAGVVGAEVARSLSRQLPTAEGPSRMVNSGRVEQGGSYHPQGITRSPMRRGVRTEVSPTSSNLPRPGGDGLGSV